MKFYVYKITFEDLPGFFYFGFHKHNNDMDSYLGSPKTWKHFWLLFGPQKQVLQWFESEEEARRTERSIILATWKDRLSLNENCNGGFSEESSRRGGKKGAQTAQDLKIGIHGLSPEEKSQFSSIGGRTTFERKSGVFSMTEEERKQASSRGGKANSKPVKCVETGEIFQSAWDVQRNKGIWQTNVSKCCRNPNKTAGGFHWEFVIEG